MRTNSRSVQVHINTPSSQNGKEGNQKSPNSCVFRCPHTLGTNVSCIYEFEKTRFHSHQVLAVEASVPTKLLSPDGSQANISDPPSGARHTHHSSVQSTAMDSVSNSAIVNGDASETPNRPRIERVINRTNTARLQIFISDKGLNTVMPSMTAVAATSVAEHRAKASQDINRIMADFER
ncbi:hypothetical protein BDP55DRAFT_183870 [Colletotrichum godetiae]|uniref:Uncharacterized protein n=1 Tax=Colletotrichum godetiae TaxID=1209918 RepID=A0AAJ0ERV7_9PEZI|nr:uncharacterized protein BDP55DRAFT_183870 [Colletotrichum godetiae]KAK1674376.1 hypothetical protein BDP55DRAFT_183870 [Colletotrichum godetiae]